jgi:parallel beta-helix repeat protein
VTERAAPHRSDRLNDRSVSNAPRGANSLLSLLFIMSLLTVIVPRAGADLLRSTCRGVQVRPGTDLQARIDAKPRGTTFCFAKGLYRLSSQIWTGDRFPRLDLRAGAVIDGQNGGFTGINGSDPPADKRGTAILGGVFQHFGNANAEGAAPVVVRRNGLVVGTEFRENFNVGLGVNGSNARVSNVYTHHNGRYGLVVTEPCAGCSGPVGVIIQGSEIAFNNTRRLPTDYDAGGTKFSGGTVGMIVRGNRVHDNYGSGLWWDGYNRNARVYGNVIYDNRNWGIMYELSLGGTKIHDNTLTGNGIGDSTADWSNNVQLLVSCSDGSAGGIEIYRNRISGSAYPLALLNNGSHPLGTTGVDVHDNVMMLRSSTARVGAIASDGMTELFGAAANNRFDHNTYRVPDRGAYWAWDGQMLTWSQWQAAGNDAHGIRRQAG